MSLYSVKVSLKLRAGVAQRPIFANAMAENFFGILKTECIYRQKLKTFQQANDLIDEYIHFYNHERLQTKTGLAPLSLRQASL